MKLHRRIRSEVGRRFPWLSRLGSKLNPARAWLRLRLLGKSREEVFTYIFQRRVWDSSESVSGGGSTLQATGPLRTELPRALRELGIRSLLDAPCGDFHWMRQADLDLDLYVGGEIVEDLVEELRRNFGEEHRRFVHLDITTDPLPEADAFFCRDCLLHLSNREIEKVIENAERSSSRFLIASTYSSCTENLDIPTGLTRPHNLTLPPFDLPPPIRVIPDPGSRTDKCMGIWDLEALRAQGR